MQDNNHASAVATQEATHGDSNWVTPQPVSKIAVVIRKPLMRQRLTRTGCQLSAYITSWRAVRRLGVGARGPQNVISPATRALVNKMGITRPTLG